MISGQTGAIKPLFLIDEEEKQFLLLFEYMVRAECQEVLISFKSLWFKNSCGFESQFANRTHVDFSPGAGFRLPVLEIGINLPSEYPF
jgi:hypothetical protein